MKKLLLTLVLLVGMFFGAFAQKLTYQAVIRDNSQQLVTNTVVKATVTITFTSGNPYQAEVNGSTNIHGLLSIEFGDESLASRDWTNATIAVKVVKANDESIVYVNEVPRPVSAVPYALSVNGQSIQNYLTEHLYVNLDKLEDTLKAYSTTAAMDARHYLTSDSAVITTMQGNILKNADDIDNLIQHTAKAAIRDSVAGQIHDSISNIAAKAHIHDNMAILNATEAPYTDADSTKLDGIAAGAEVNVQSDWKQAATDADDYIKNKPSITDTVNNILTMGKYVTETALDNRHYLRSDSTVITTMQGNITANATNITSLQGNLSAAISKEKTDSITLAGRINTLETASMDCNDVKECIKDTLSKYTTTDNLCNVINTCDLSSNTSIQELLQNLSNRIDEQNEVIGKLNRALDSVSQLIPFVCGASLVVDHEGNKYKTVEIITTSGKQCWMAENMRCTTAPAENGVTLVAGGLSLNLTDYSTPRYYPSGNVKPDDIDSATYVNIYGILYNFPAAMAINTQPSSFDENHRGICPEGWHIPTREEFITLTNTPYWDETTAFNPLPAGYINKIQPKIIQEFPTGNCFWSATPSVNIINANALYHNVQDDLVIDAFYRNSAFSVRCIRNN